MVSLEPASRRLRRRLVTIPRHLLLLAMGLALAPLLLPALLIVDATRWLSRRTPFMALRLYGFGVWYLAVSVLTLLRGGLQWVRAGFGRDRQRLQDLAFHLRVDWTTWLLAGASRAFRLRFESEGLDDAAPGPVLVLPRHASVVDNLLPTTFIEGPCDLLLRYVVKAQLRAEPCIDIGGSRLPVAFIDRGAAGEAAKLESFFADMGPKEGALIYPEGTRFSPSRRERRLEQLREQDPARAARAEALRHLLAPKPGGFLAAMRAAPAADVAILGHVGFDGFTRVDDIWAGALLGRTVRMKLTRYSRAELPTEPGAIVAWLDDRWQELDAWIEGALEPSGG